MIFDKALVGNSRTSRDQWAEVNAARIGAAMQDKVWVNAGVAQLNAEERRKFAANDGFIPRDLYQEFDNVTVERMRSDDGDTFLNDLLALSTSVSIGTLVHNFRMASDAGNTQTSMTGQIGVKMDQVDFTFDGFIVPVTDTGFFRNWREKATFDNSGFDALIDDQRESVATIRRSLADQFLDGHKDKSGNFIVVDGKEWQGMRNDSHVAQVANSAFDFTDDTKTGAEIKAAFATNIRDVLWITNKCEMPVTYYISREIASIWEQQFTTQYAAKTIEQEIGNLQGVAAIKVSSKLSGNEIMGFPLDQNKVRTLVGMGINTVAMPRPMYNSNFDFAVWGAIGYEIRNDFAGRTCALMYS